jgi:single-strand DNA-binding protein
MIIYHHLADLFLTYLDIIITLKIFYFQKEDYMLNNVVLVGRVVEAPVLKRFEGEYSGTFFTLAVGRPYRNMENKIETDFIRIVVWEGLAENVSQYCHKGDVIGVRGRLSMRKIEVRLQEGEEPKTINTVDVIGERIVFISSAKKKEKDVEETIDL